MSKMLFFFVLSLFASRVCCQTAPFDPREATVESTHYALLNGLNTCREVVTAFLTRIELLNHRINAIISLNADVLSDADHLDEQLQRGNATQPLFCIPILLKDNYDTANMPTTGGCLALRNLQPAQDAPSVKALKNSGAIILGKTNLHELALEGLSVSSYGGQTINPYDSARTPGGSSGGSAAAVAASFSVFATGTDTVNSLRSPASANSLFSIRPTRGLISRAGVIPVSYTQDTLGIIARTVNDVAAGLAALATIGFDPEDNITALIPETSRNIDYLTSLQTRDLSSLRLGLVTTLFNRTASPETNPVNFAMDVFVSRLKAAGVSIIKISDPKYNSGEILSKYDTQRFEYRELMDKYLSQHHPRGDCPSSLEELYAPRSAIQGGQFLVIPSQYKYVKTALKSSTSNSTYAAVQSGIQNLTLALWETFQQNELDALIYPEQQNLVVKIGSPSQFGRNGILAAVTGSPVVTVPIGFSNSSKTAPNGVPIGIEILGKPWEEQKLLDIARSIELLGTIRRPPAWAEEIVEAKSIISVPNVLPDRENIARQYPRGQIDQKGYDAITG